MHRELLIEKRTKPSKTEFRDYKVVVESWFNKLGELHSVNDKPALIYYEKGKMTSECWYKNGFKHRDRNRPAIIWYNNGNAIRKWGFKNGEFTKGE